MAEGSGRERLRRLGEGQPISDVAASDGLDRAAFDAWWADETAARLPDYDGERSFGAAAAAGPEGTIEILRDERGVPHVIATSDSDLFFGYGYAMAQDRLFQMDLRRRRGMGRMAEVLGPDVLEADVLARTLDLPRLAREELGRHSPESVALLEAFAAGVNALVADTGANPPIEFDLLGYRPEPWTPLDSVACTASWRWQLTGRPWVISVPELARRTLGDGPLYDAFIAFQREQDQVSIIAPGSYPAERVGALPAAIGAGAVSRRGIDSPLRAGRARGAMPVGAGASADGGSNDWVVGGAWTKSGLPMVASDPHMPYESASSFFEVHLSGGSFEVAGAGFVGMPGITFGRNRRLAWGITNNICSLRDLYVERHDAVTNERVERIEVQGRNAEELTVLETPRGPIVDRLLPKQAAPEGPVSMRWVGQLDCEWFAAQLRLNRAESVEESFDALRGWLAPTFSMVVADDAGRIGYHATGAIPIRERPSRAYRDGADPDDQWAGLIPPDGMPQVIDPPTGWISTANNRPAPDDFPYPLSGTWDENHRAKRIGELIEAEGEGAHDLASFGRIHGDVRPGRANDNLAALVAALRQRVGEWDRDADALAILAAWDQRATADSAGAALYEITVTRWAQAVAAERFPPKSSDFVAGYMNGFAMRLLREDEVGWFADDETRLDRLARAFHDAVAELTEMLGPDQSTWRWGDLHRFGPHHPLSGRGELAALLDKPAVPIGGDMGTVHNTGFPGSRIPATRPDAWRNWEAASGCGFRMVADLGDPHGSLWTITGEGQSAHPGDPHALDQVDDFVAVRYREVPLDRERATSQARHRLVLRPVRRTPSA